MVEQEPYLVDDTITNNIAIVTPNIQDSDIKQAAMMANVSEFAEEKPGNYDFVIGPNGNKLSIGQKQRIAIARTIIRSPDVLLLDEPLSNVDKKSEAYILETIGNLTTDTIVFMVSHKSVPDGHFNIAIDFDKL